ncbi:MAG: hypothetical protein JWO22_2921 [Frankiales bacterium]|nr:hypothetical protein [Frankiales bacterium]
MYAVDAQDCHLKWIQRSLLDYGMALVGTKDNDLVVVTQRSYREGPVLEKVDAKTFIKRWRTALPRGDFFAVSGDYAVVIASAQSYAGHGEAQVLDQKTGKPLWRKRFPLPRVATTGD